MDKDTTLIAEPATDPVDDLQDFIEAKTEALKNYAKRETRNEAYLQRQITEIQTLEGILDRLDFLKLYRVWVEAEDNIKKHQSDIDGVTIHIPLKSGARPERFLNLTAKC